MRRPSTYALAITDAEAAVRRSDLSRGTPAECAELRGALRALIQAVETLADEPRVERPIYQPGMEHFR